MNGFFYRLKITLRNLRNNKLYTVINTGGLVTGFAAVVFIVLWVKDELGYDSFHQKYNDMYVVVNQPFRYSLSPVSIM